MKILANLDLHQCELQNFRIQNLASAPANPVVGQHYYNTVANTEYVWNGTKWIDALSQGDYTFQNGIELVDGTRNVQIKLATGEDAGNIAFVANENGLKADVSLAGYAKATERAAIGTSDTLDAALGKLEKKADDAVIANSAITASTHTKITYDAKGLVTGGADLSAADIPNLDTAKVTTASAYLKATEAAAIGTGDSLNTALGKLEFKADAAVVANASITASTHTKITYDSKGLVTAGADLTEADIPALHLTKVTDVTATKDEVNELHEAGAVKADFEKLHAVTASADELNILDGATLSTTELNYVDGVTSSIQNQLDSKVAKNADITASTHTKITYDKKGLVTGGADLSEADIPNLQVAKINAMTGYTKATERAAVGTTDTLSAAIGKLEYKADAAVVANASITASTHTKITYDAKGLVTGGTELSAADIPSLATSKITALTGYTIATEAAAIGTGDSLNQALGKIQKTLDGKIGLDAISIDAGSTNYLEYDNATGKLSAKAGVANGLATLDANGTVPAAQLPSYVDDVLNLIAISATAPATCAKGDLYYNSTSKKIFKATAANTWDAGSDPEVGKIYVNLDNEMSYRWSGTAMVQIGADKLKGFNGTITGDGTTTSFTVTHGLGTRNVVFEIYEAASPYEKIYANVNHSTTSALTVSFGAAPAVGDNYIVTVIAIA